MATLQDYQYEYRGLLMGSGTYYEIDELSGLSGLNFRIGDRDFPRSHGQIPGKLLANYRLITVDMKVRVPGGTAETIAPFVRNVEKMISPDQGTRDGTIPDDEWDKFVWKEPGLDEQFIRARPVRSREPRRHDTEFGIRPITFQLRAADPRKYGTTQRTLTHTAGNTPASKEFVITNDGTAKAYPLIHYLTGSNTGGFIKNRTTGVEIHFEDLLINSTYQFDMDAVIRGARKEAFTYVGPLTTVPDTEKYPYYKWLVPRKPFFIHPGNNDLAISFNDTVTLWWNDTYL